jgi:anionic cell wall polymer biosynthesis LytR-Cps2A-Psr (LCP) family protein
METRNTPLLREIINALSAARHINDGASALNTLEDHFRTNYVLKAGGTKDVAEFAQSLRLNITETECAAVLDYIAQKAMAGITIDEVETAVYELFGNRFIEPQ